MGWCGGNAIGGCRPSPSVCRALGARGWQPRSGNTPTAGRDHGRAPAAPPSAQSGVVGASRAANSHMGCWEPDDKKKCPHFRHGATYWQHNQKSFLAYIEGRSVQPPLRRALVGALAPGIPMGCAGKWAFVGWILFFPCLAVEVCPRPPFPPPLRRRARWCGSRTGVRGCCLSYAMGA